MDRPLDVEQLERSSDVRSWTVPLTFLTPPLAQFCLLACWIPCYTHSQSQQPYGGGHLSRAESVYFNPLWYQQFYFPMDTEQ